MLPVVKKSIVCIPKMFLVVKKCNQIDCMPTEMPPVVKKCKEIKCMPTDMPPVVKRCKEIDCMLTRNASCSKEM